MTATERRQEILNTISTEGSVRASDLAERLNVPLKRSARI